MSGGTSCIWFKITTLISWGSLFGVYIAAPKLSEFLNSKSKKVQNIICITLSVLFIIDLICCAIFGFNKGEGVGGTY